jgi:hypothetical protein
MFFDSLDALARVPPSIDRFGKNVDALIMKGGGTKRKTCTIGAYRAPGRQLIVGDIMP